MTPNFDLIRDAQNHLNFRTRGKEARLARLAAGGVPTDREGMAAWLSAALDSQLEANGGVYHCCTVRVTSGCDAELPTRNGIGCRISRIPVQAHLVNVGDPIDDENVAEEAFWSVCYGSVGPGYMAPVFISMDQAATAEEAASIVRRRLIGSGECFASRNEAFGKVTEMLQERAGA